MSQQYQSGMHINLIISLPQDNTESVCLSVFRVGMFHTAAKESDKNKKSLSLIMSFVKPNSFSSFSCRHP